MHARVELCTWPSALHHTALVHCAELQSYGWLAQRRMHPQTSLPIHGMTPNCQVHMQRNSTANFGPAWRPTLATTLQPHLFMSEQPAQPASSTGFDAVVPVPDIALALPTRRAPGGMIIHQAKRLIRRSGLAALVLLVLGVQMSADAARWTHVSHAGIVPATACIGIGLAHACLAAMWHCVTQGGSPLLFGAMARIQYSATFSSLIHAWAAVGCIIGALSSNSLHLGTKVETELWLAAVLLTWQTGYLLLRAGYLRSAWNAFAHMPVSDHPLHATAEMQFDHLRMTRGCARLAWIAEQVAGAEPLAGIPQESGLDLGHDDDDDEHEESEDGPPLHVGEMSEPPYMSRSSGTGAADSRPSEPTGVGSPSAASEPAEEVHSRRRKHRRSRRKHQQSSEEVGPSLASGAAAPYVQEHLPSSGSPAATPAVHAHEVA